MHLSGAPEGGKPHPCSQEPPRAGGRPASPAASASCHRPRSTGTGSCRPGTCGCGRSARSCCAHLAPSTWMRSGTPHACAAATEAPQHPGRPPALPGLRPHRGLPRAGPWGHPGGPGSRSRALSPPSGIPGGPCTRRPSVGRHRGQKGRRKSGAGRQVPGLGETPRRHFGGCGLSSPAWKTGSRTIGVAGGAVNRHFACSRASATTT